MRYLACVCYLTLFGAQAILAQKQANIWHFGVGAGLNFNTSPPSPISGGQTYYPVPNLWNEGTSTICDSSGALLFYTNGDVLWNRYHEVTPNGAGLGGHPSATQGALIVPQPQSDRYFWVFVTEDMENGYDGLFYSVVDACADSGRGDVVPGMKKVLLHTLMAELVTATSHANGIDYWILGHEVESDVFHVYQLTPTGITNAMSFELGNVDSLGWGTQAVFSPDGTRMAYTVTTLYGHFALYDFDPATGILSNPRTRVNDMAHMFWGLAFSPDATRLYLTAINQGALRQMDMTAGSWSDILASEIELASLSPSRWMDLRLGPDDRIYVSKGQHTAIGVIAYPDVLGSGCQFTDEVVDVAGTCSFGLPNVITDYAYRNKRLNCSSTGVEDIDADAPHVHAFADPVLDLLNVDYVLATTGPVDIRLLDLQGRVVDRPLSTVQEAGAHQASYDLSELSSGCYILRLATNNRTFATRFVKR